KQMGEFDLLDPFKKVWHKLTDWMHSDGVKEFVMNLLQIRENIINFFQDLPGNIGGFLNMILEKIATFVLQAGLFFESLPGEIAAYFDDAADFIERWGVRIGEWFKNLPALIASSIGDAASWLIQKGIDFIAGLLQGV